MERVRSRLSTLWIFATLNYLYCDVVSLMDPELLRRFVAGTVGGMHISQGFLLAAAALVEIPMAMVLLSRVLPPRANRVVNISAGVIMTTVQLLSVVAKPPTPYYLFFSVIEIATTAFVVLYAWKLAGVPEAPELTPQPALEPRTYSAR